MVLFVLQYECWITHTISATQDSTYNRIHTHTSAMQGSTYTQSSAVMQAAIQGVLGLLNAAKVPGFYTGTHFAYPGGMTRTGFEPIPVLTGPDVG